jgi:hypothetical protein
MPSVPVSGMEGSMLTKRYLTSVKNLPAVFKKIVEGVPPDKFTVSHMKSLGFTSSNDYGIPALLKDLGFLSDDGTPTDRYKEYRDRSRSKAVMGQALKEAYEDLFHVNEHPTEADRQAIEGKFKSTHGSTDRVAQEQATTFYALLKLADLDGAVAKPKALPLKKEEPAKEKAHVESTLPTPEGVVGSRLPFSGFRYNIEIHLPASKDPEVYNAIFRSLKEHLFDE